MKYIITKTSALEKYFGMGEIEQDVNMYCRDLYTLFDLSCVQISEPLFDTVYPLIPAGYEEVTADEARYGSLFFSEVRDVIKVYAEDGRAETEDPAGLQAKVELPMTDEIRTHIRNFMYRFAKEIIETEYNYRFKNLRNTTELEQASWEIQKHEAKEWLTYGGSDGHVTPFLDYLATERGEDKTDLANKILVKSEEYADKLSTELVKYQLLLKEFKNALTVWDINILYEKYFGIMMPAYQSAAMGLQDEYGIRIFTDPETGEVRQDDVNPFFGNKLNF